MSLILFVNAWGYIWVDAQYICIWNRAAYRHVWKLLCPILKWHFKDFYFIIDTRFPVKVYLWDAHNISWHKTRICHTFMCSNKTHRISGFPFKAKFCMGAKQGHFNHKKSNKYIERLFFCIHVVKNVAYILSPPNKIDMLYIVSCSHSCNLNTRSSFLRNEFEMGFCGWNPLKCFVYIFENRIFPVHFVFIKCSSNVYVAAGVKTSVIQSKRKLDVNDTGFFPISWRKGEGVFYLKPPLTFGVGSFIIIRPPIEFFKKNFCDNELLRCVPKKVAEGEEKRKKVFGIVKSLENLQQVSAQNNVLNGQMVTMQEYTQM